MALSTITKLYIFCEKSIIFVPSWRNDLAIHSSFTLTMAMPQPTKFTAFRHSCLCSCSKAQETQRTVCPEPEQCQSQESSFSGELLWASPGCRSEQGGSGVLNACNVCACDLLHLKKAGSRPDVPPRTGAVLTLKTPHML